VGRVWGVAICGGRPSSRARKGEEAAEEAEEDSAAAAAADWALCGSATARDFCREATNVSMRF